MDPKKDPEYFHFPVPCLDLCQGVILLVYNEASFLTCGTPRLSSLRSILRSFSSFAAPLANEEGSHPTFRTVFTVGIDGIGGNGTYSIPTQTLLETDTLLKAYAFIEGSEGKIFNKEDTVYCSPWFRTLLICSPFHVQ